MVMKLPLQNTTNYDLTILQTKWKALIDPVLANPMTNLSILRGVHLVAGDNQISHLLQAKQQGWVILDIDAPATIYRNQPFNDIYLFLNASAPVVITLGVF